jgi:hypothetical protein
VVLAVVAVKIETCSANKSVKTVVRTDFETHCLMTVTTR